jgi:hypothetical protein
MSGTACRLGWTGLLLTAFVVGCSTKAVDRVTPDEEPSVRARFADLQSAFKNHDIDKLWSLLSDKSQADAERAAKDIQNAYTKASAEEKTKLDETLGLKETEVAELTGKGFLKSKRFQKKYDEVPESKIDQVEVQGDSATIYFLEPDGDREKAILVRQDGQWKVWLTMPRVRQP